MLEDRHGIDLVLGGLGARDLSLFRHMLDDDGEAPHGACGGDDLLERVELGAERAHQHAGEDQHVLRDLLMTPRPLALRRMTAEDGRPVLFALGQPSQSATDANRWSCTVDITVGDVATTESVDGIDSLMTIQLALEVLWRNLSPLRCT